MEPWPKVDVLPYLMINFEKYAKDVNKITRKERENIERGKRGTKVSFWSFNGWEISEWSIDSGTS